MPQRVDVNEGTTEHEFAWSSVGGEYKQDTQQQGCMAVDVTTLAKGRS
jgi:cation transport regulator ChaB